MQGSIFLWAVSLSILAMLGSQPALAKDKDQIELTCGTTKATITCTKFSDTDRRDGVCVASQVKFETKYGANIFPNNSSVKKYSKVPSVAEDLECVKSNKKIYFSVMYSPDCDAAMCVQYFFYSEAGSLIDKNSTEYNLIGSSKDLSFTDRTTIRSFE